MEKKLHNIIKFVPPQTCVQYIVKGSLHIYIDAYAYIYMNLHDCDVFRAVIL